ncbi:MAG: C45 family peptidase [Planctomycetota bacterium]|nr:C45 family peptidase [Planctomycetota bacterium]
MLRLRLSLMLLLVLTTGTMSAQTRPVVGLRVLDLGGTAIQRGEQHGRVLKQEIHSLVRKWKDHLRQTYEVEPTEFIERFVARTNFEPAIDKWTPGLLDEVRGIARGAEIDFDTIYVFNLIDEVWAQGRQVLVEKCTTIGVDRRGSQPTVVAQNLDLPVFYHGTTVVLRITDESGFQTLVTTLPGLVGANGMNRARVAVTVNSLLQLRPCRDGLPVAFVVRGVLQKKTWWEARQFLYRVKHASGQNYIVGGPDVAHSFECSAGRVVRYQPFEGAQHTWHTNHPLRNQDWHPDFLKRAKQRGKTPSQAIAPCPRFEELARRLRAAPRVGVPEVLAGLASKDASAPICNKSTFACTIFLLGRQPRMRVSAGGSADHQFTDLEFPARPVPRRGPEKPPKDGEVDRG